MGQRVCVFCASSNLIDPGFLALATEVGTFIGQAGHTLVYGGGRVGMLGAVARGVHSHGGKVVGVIPDFLRDREVAYEQADELIITQDLFERKRVMLDHSDVYLILPGGFGTLDEWLEVMTLKQLRRHSAPIIVLNHRGFFDEVIAFYHKVEAMKFAPEDHGYFQVIPSLAPLAQMLES